MRLPPGIERIAVLRALQLGDMLCAVPALRALRRGLPEAEIVLVGLPWARELTRRLRTCVDDLLALPGWPGLPEAGGGASEIPAFLAAAQRRGFDLVVQLHGSGDVTNTLAVLLGGRRTAGFFRPGSFCPDPELYLPYPESGREAERLLQLTRFLGLPSDHARLEFPLEDADREAVAALPEADGLRAGEYVCVHPGSRLSSRRWPPERFADVADALSRDGLDVVLTGSDGERPITARVSAAMAAPAVDLAGRTSLGALAALVADSRLVVCNDTGISHLAAALAVPSVVVFTVSDPERWAPADAWLHRAVRPAIDGVDAVLAEARALLRSPGDRRRASSEIAA